MNGTSQAAVQFKELHTAKINTEENMIFVVVDGKITPIKPPEYGTVEVTWKAHHVDRAVVTESIKF